MRMPTMPGAGRAGFTAFLALAAGILLAFFALPLVALVGFFLGKHWMFK